MEWLYVDNCSLLVLEEVIQSESAIDPNDLADPVHRCNEKDRMGQEERIHLVETPGRKEMERVVGGEEESH